MYKKSLVLIDEFCKMSPADRQKTAETMFKVDTAKKHVGEKTGKHGGPKISEQGAEKPPIDLEISKVVGGIKISLTRQVILYSVTIII